MEAEKYSDQRLSEMTTISSLIETLEKIKKSHGDVKICVSCVLDQNEDFMLNPTKIDYTIHTLKNMDYVILHEEQ